MTAVPKFEVEERRDWGFVEMRRYAEALGYTRKSHPWFAYWGKKPNSDAVIYLISFDWDSPAGWVEIPGEIDAVLRKWEAEDPYSGW